MKQVLDSKELEKKAEEKILTSGEMPINFKKYTQEMYQNSIAALHLEYQKLLRIVFDELNGKNVKLTKEEVCLTRLGNRTMYATTKKMFPVGSKTFVVLSFLKKVRNSDKQNYEVKEQLIFTSLDELKKYNPKLQDPNFKLELESNIKLA